MSRLSLRQRVLVATLTVGPALGAAEVAHASPLFELVADPGERGQRPAHLLARSHRIVGDARALERYGDAKRYYLEVRPGIVVSSGRSFSRGIASRPMTRSRPRRSHHSPTTEIPSACAAAWSR